MVALVPVEAAAAAPGDVTFQNGGAALLSNPVTIDGVIYSHSAPSTGKMADIMTLLMAVIVLVSLIVRL
ncbi:hypothetical protein HB39_13475 [Vibrio parahaemolyticus]|nr:hypothetical protein HB39_13475 [Vibrio parahaemolyticus]